MNSFSITDIGMKRKVNQDYVFREENPIGRLPNLFIVADGMGGHNAGDYASRYSVQIATEQIKKSNLKTPIGILEEAIKAANEELFKRSNEQKELEGMGTTFVAATIYGKNMYVANIGDSRLYLIRNEIRQVTEDHSLVEAMIKTGEIKRKDARFHPNKNIITRAVGTGKQVIADYFEIELVEKDIVLMCSDGLSNMLDDEEIKVIVKQYSDNLVSAARHLIDKANQLGGKDNIAIIIIKP